MKKIYLKKIEKSLLLKLNEQTIPDFETNEDYCTAAQSLDERGLIKLSTNRLNNGKPYRAGLTKFGKAYLSNNPKLYNPMTNNAKWWISISITILSAITGLFKTGIIKL
jgi:hypothetical protein